MKNAMSGELKALFTEVERHAMALVSGESSSRLSKEESAVLTLQAINRLNQRIGFLARAPNKNGELRLLQRYVNNLTLGVKSMNSQGIRSALASVRNIITMIEKAEPL